MYLMNISEHQLINPSTLLLLRFDEFWGGPGPVRPPPGRGRVMRPPRGGSRTGAAVGGSGGTAKSCYRQSEETSSLFIKNSAEAECC